MLYQLATTLHTPRAPAINMMAGALQTAPAINIDQALEQCILGAKSEDEVQSCMIDYDEALDAAGYEEDVSPLEACLLNADGEVEVEACIAKYDNEASPNISHDHDNRPTAMTTDYDVAEALGMKRVEECILDAKSEDEVQMCMAMLDDEFDV